MATRLDVQARRKSLYDNLKRSCLEGTLAPGVMLPSVRELGEQYGVSANVVFGVIQSLTDEGVIYTVPRVGAFVGRPQPQTIEPYLMIVPSREVVRENFWLQTQAGFEDRIAQLGGNSIVLTPQEAKIHLERNDLPPLSGVFNSDRIEGGHGTDLFEEQGVPSVIFGIERNRGKNSDRVVFDDINGGAQATNHLWQNGHRTIAFLALHSRNDAHQFEWSLQREQGWRRALEQVGGQSEGLVFYPPHTSGFTIAEQIEISHQTAQQLIGREDITAVVVANTFAAQAMFEEFQRAHWPAEKWPAVVCFDAAPGAGSSVVSYLRLPWEEVGREAAQILWERRNGHLKGNPIQKLVSMRLIARLSCRSDWAISSGLAQSRASEPITRGVQPHSDPLVVLGI